jgi:hypothetical protein
LLKGKKEMITYTPPLSIWYMPWYLQLIDYHTSAVLAATLDTASLPYRTVNPIHMCDIVSSFQSHGKKVMTTWSALRSVKVLNLSKMQGNISHHADMQSKSE